MEQHYMPSDNTNLLGSAMLTRLSDPCDICKYPGFPEHYQCSCPEDPPVRYVCMLVYIEGSTAPSPDLCVYHITIWDTFTTKSNATPCLLWDTDSIQFSVQRSIHLDRYQYEQIYIYCPLLLKLTSSDYTFKGKKDRQSYIKHFQTLVTEIYQSKEQKDKTECAHVKQRKKGHSHNK